MYYKGYTIMSHCDLARDVLLKLEVHISTMELIIKTSVQNGNRCIIKKNGHSVIVK